MITMYAAIFLSKNYYSEDEYFMIATFEFESFL